MPARRLAQVRYAVVGLGHIAQVAMLPAFAHARRNSRLMALASDDATKRKAYEYAEGLAYALTIDGRTTRKRIGKRDQFAPELLYFSGCIRRNRSPEPSGEEGLQDVRIVQALYESAETGRVVQLPPFRGSKQPSPAQKIRRPGVAEPELVGVKSAGMISGPAQSALANVELRK